MHPKNLGWKFAFVGLLIVMCVYTIWAKGLRQGIDLKGGHVLTFEVQTDERRQETLIPDVIRTLKRRIDPNGLYSLEWKPVGLNRFEVRMPLGSDEAQKAKQSYLAAIDVLESHNIQRSVIEEVASNRATRESLIAAAEKTDPQRAVALRAVARTNDALLEAVAKVERLEKAGTTPEELSRAEADRKKAKAEYEKAVSDTFETNVKVEQLGQFLSLYVSEREARGLSKDAVRSRRKALDQHLEKLKVDHPARVEEIDAVVSGYRRWADKRSGLDDPADLKRMVGSAGVLEFRIAPTLPASGGSGELALDDKTEYQPYMAQLQSEGPQSSRRPDAKFVWFPLRTGSDERFSANLVVGKYAERKYVLLYNEPSMVMVHDPGAPPWSLSGAHPTRDDKQMPAVGFDFDARGARLMGNLTAANHGHFMAILLDDQAYSVPVIRATIYEHGIIQGDFSNQQVNDLVQTLEAGSLQGRVNDNPVSEKTIAPSIGEDNRRAGLRAAFWALLATVAFMLVYYMMAGSIADSAMLFNLLLTLGAMSFIDAVFTLPGIAGLTLSTAMAVDANVLIYERLREEQRKSLSIRMAFKNAYSNAFSAIFDSNITTLIAALILGWVGTEEVKGFAITLGLGVLFNLFTAVSVTRWVFQWLIERGLVKDRVRMLGLIGVPNIDWMGKRWIFWGCSLATTVIGLVAFFWQGKDILGIEFSSGTQATFSFRPGVLIPLYDKQGNPVKLILPERGQIEQDLASVADRLAREAAEQVKGLEAKLASASDAERPAIQKELDRARAKVADLPKLDPKVETLIDRRKVDQVLEKFDADRDGLISASPEWADGGGDPAFFAELDANRDNKLDRAELEKALPERSYQISTKIPEADFVHDVVSAAFQRALDTRTRVTFEPVAGGALDRFGVTLEPDQKGLTHISLDMANRSDASVRAKFLDFVGGVLLVVDKVNPPMTEDDLAGRIKTMRLQPDFQDYQFNRTAVIGVRPTPDGKAYTSLAVLVHNQNTDYRSRPEEWSKFADQERTLLAAALNREESLDSVSKFDAAVAGEARQLAVIACVLAWLCIIVYLWVRFGQARWGVAAVVCIVHDLTISIGLVALSGWIGETRIGQALLITPVKVDMTVIAAFLTIIGYSVNDTIVVFDRIRENRGKLTTVNETIINNAINQTLSRTLLTSTAVIFALFIMYAIGGAGIHPFCFAMLPGVLVGTYSSIAVAAPLLLGFKVAAIGRGTPNRKLPLPTPAPAAARVPAPTAGPPAPAEDRE